MVKKFHIFRQVFQDMVIKERRIIFLDKIKFDAKLLKVNPKGISESNFGTLAFAISSDKKFIKPLLVLPSDYAEYASIEYKLLTCHSSCNGDIDDISIIYWMENVISKLQANVYIYQFYKFLKLGDFLKKLLAENALCYTYPKGLVCMLNPFREIIPEIIQILNDENKMYLNLGDYHKNKIAEWITNSINKFFKSKPRVFENIFNILLSPNAF